MGLSDKEIKVIEAAALMHADQLDRDVFSVPYAKGLAAGIGTMLAVSEGVISKGTLDRRNGSRVLANVMFRAYTEARERFEEAFSKNAVVVNATNLTNEEIADAIRERVLNDLEGVAPVSSVVKEAESILKGESGGEDIA